MAKKRRGANRLSATLSLWIADSDSDAHRLTTAACSVLRCSLEIWDTAGQERFKAMAPLYCRNAVGALAVFDVTRRDSTNALRSFVHELRCSAKEPVVVLVSPLSSS